MTKFLKLFAAILLLWTTTARAEQIDLTASIWSVCATDGNYSWNETQLVFTSQTAGPEGFNVEGYFDWRGQHDSFGREYFDGTLALDGWLMLQGKRLENDQNLAAARYRATLSKNGDAIVDGIWLGAIPGVWSAAREDGQNTALSSCEPADLMS